MNLYEEIPDSGQIYYLLATDDTDAVTKFTAAFPNESMNPPTLIAGDFSLLNPGSYQAHFYLKCKSGNKFLVSGGDYKAALIRLHAAFTGELAVAGEELTGNWTLVANPDTTVPDNPANRNFFGAIVHFAQSNNGDYPASKIPIAIDAALTMGHSGQKISISMNGSGVPSRKADLDAWLTAMDATTMQKWGIISVKGRRNSTAVGGFQPSSNPLPEPANGSTYTDAELLSEFDAHYAKSNGLLVTNGYQGKFQYLECGNEVDTQYIKLATGTSFNSSNYDTEAYKMHFAGMFGMMMGIRAADPTVKVGINGGFIHWGHCTQMGMDAKSTPAYLAARGIPAGSDKHWDFYSLHWYNDMEYAKSTTGVPYLKTAMSMLRSKAGSLYPSLGIGESGLNVQKTNPNNLNTAQYNQLSIDQYWHGTTGPKADHYIIYEMFLEPGRAASSLGESKFGLQDGSTTTLSPTVITLANKPPFPQ